MFRVHFLFPQTFIYLSYLSSGAVAYSDELPSTSRFGAQYGKYYFRRRALLNNNIRAPRPEVDDFFNFNNFIAHKKRPVNLGRISPEAFVTKKSLSGVSVKSGQDQV